MLRAIFEIAIHSYTFFSSEGTIFQASLPVTEVAAAAAGTIVKLLPTGGHDSHFGAKIAGPSCTFSQTFHREKV